MLITPLKTAYVLRTPLVIFKYWTNQERYYKEPVLFSGDITLTFPIFSGLLYQSRIICWRYNINKNIYRKNEITMIGDLIFGEDIVYWSEERKYERTKINNACNVKDLLYGEKVKLMEKKLDKFVLEMEKDE